MAGLNVQLSGSLRVRPTSGCTDGASSPGAAFNFGLRPVNRSATLDGGSARATVDTPNAFVAQPWTNGLRATSFYLRLLTDAAVTLRLTFETTGAVDMPCQGVVVLELPSTDRLTGLSIQGTATFEWQATGAQA